VSPISAAISCSGRGAVACKFQRVANALLGVHAFVWGSASGIIGVVTFSTTALQCWLSTWSVKQVLSIASEAAALHLPGLKHCKGQNQAAAPWLCDGGH